MVTSKTSKDFVHQSAHSIKFMILYQAFVNAYQGSGD